MPTFTFEKLLNDPKSRKKFFQIYDDMINNLKRSGFVESATRHAKNRKRIRDELALFD